MSLSAQILLTSQARESFIRKCKNLPVAINPDIKTKTRAAVLVPLCVKNEQVHLLYTLRSTQLKHHSGQISFPGGKMEGEETSVDTALRETEEEIGVACDTVDVWCEMPPVLGRDKRMIITPVVGVINNLNMDHLKPNLFEVEEIFTVSMDSLCDKDNHANFLFNEMEFPIFVNGRHKIWGLTGFITHVFLQTFLPSNAYNPDFSKKQYTWDELTPSKL